MNYVFRCDKCNNETELDMKISEYEKMKESLNFPKCPDCGEDMNRVFTPPSFLGSTGGYDSVVGKASWQSN